MLSPHETTINTPKSLRVSARSLSSRLPIQHISFPTFTSASSHCTLGYSATLVLSFRGVVPCRTSSTHLHTHSSPISNCIGPASAATRAASFKSLYRKRAGATCYPYDYSVDARSRYNTRTSGSACSAPRRKGPLHANCLWKGPLSRAVMFRT